MSICCVVITRYTKQRSTQGIFFPLRDLPVVSVLAKNYATVKQANRVLSVRSTVVTALLKN